jgi:hypothetical protein
MRNPSNPTSAHPIQIENVATESKDTSALGGASAKLAG